MWLPLPDAIEIININVKGKVLFSWRELDEKIDRSPTTVRSL